MYGMTFSYGHILELPNVTMLITLDLLQTTLYNLTFLYENCSEETSHYTKTKT